MAGLFGTLNIGRSGMTAAQTAVTTTSHNISNLNTEGYSRQRVNLVTARAESVTGYGQVGTGTLVDSITRIRNTFIDYQYRAQNSALGQSTQRSDFFSQIEQIYNEPSDSAISNSISEFFNAWQELYKQPANVSNRTAVAEQTKSLTDQINNTYTKIENLEKNAQTLLQSNATDVNSLLDRIKNLNEQIKIVTVAGETPNDLMDSRDLLIDELSSKFEIEVEQTNFNGVNIKYKDKTLVSADKPNDIGARLSYISDVQDIGNGKFKVTYYRYGDTTDINNQKTIEIEFNGTAEDLKKSRLVWGDLEGEVSDGSTIKTFNPELGEIAGNQNAQEDIKEQMNKLDDLAKALAYSVNAIYMKDSDPKVPFFVNSESNPASEDGITAKNITINPDIYNKPGLINTSKAASAAEGAEGDNSRALAIAQLSGMMLSVGNINNSSSITVNEDFSIENDTNGATLHDYFSNVVDQLGIKSQEAKRQVTNQTLTLSSIDDSRQQVAGVSLDEELSYLIQYQHAYNANAKIISTIDELLDVVVNGLKK